MRSRFRRTRVISGPPEPGATVPLLMAAGTSPSIGGSESRFSERRRSLDSGENRWPGDTGLGMMAGTSPSMDGSLIAFEANTGVLGGEKASRHRCQFRC